LLEPGVNVRTTRRATRQAGFTLIELIVVGTIAAILLTVAIGGFSGTFPRKRLESVAGDIATHLQQARSEAVARNVPVRVTFGTNCLLVHTWPLTATTAPTCNGSVVTSAAPVTVITPLERVANDVTVTREPAATPVSFYQFNPTFDPAAGAGNGWMLTDGGANHGLVVGSAAGSWRLRLRVGPTGRVELCTTTALAGYAAC
jgi:prepilin-type N-terminal cleavage/methylation domain-containing protein